MRDANAMRRPHYIAHGFLRFSLLVHHNESNFCNSWIKYLLKCMWLKAGHVTDTTSTAHRRFLPRAKRKHLL